MQAPRVRTAGRQLGLRTALHRSARSLGYDLVKRHYYSEVPDLDTLPPGIFSERSALHAVRWDVDEMLGFVSRELAPLVSEFDSALPEFALDNTFYEGLDAETLYAMVRRYRPQRVLELGSGFSTTVIAAALEHNGNGRHDVYDPFPATGLPPTPQVHAIPAREVPLDEFARLGDGDILFVDTTHTVKIGSDVNRLILDVLPLLAPGVVIHFHDIYLPYEYPREFYTELGFSWAEQYLLQAFLAFNDEFETLFGNAALQRDRRAQITALVPSAATSRRPSAFWMRRQR